MRDPIKGAEHTATVLGVIKWVVVALWVIYGVGLWIFFWQTEGWPEWVEVLQPVSALSCLIAAGVSWALIGWMQYLLATNVAQTPRELPPARYITAVSGTGFTPREEDPWEAPTVSGSTSAP